MGNFYFFYQNIIVLIFKKNKLTLQAHNLDVVSSLWIEDNPILKI